MNVDKELEKLSHSTPPKQRRRRRARALTAAMQAFDTAGNNALKRPKEMRKAGVKAPSSTGYGALP